MLATRNLFANINTIPKYKYNHTYSVKHLDPCKAFNFVSNLWDTRENAWVVLPGTPDTS